VKKKPDIDGMKAGDELDKLVALNVFHVAKNSMWFVKNKKKTQYLGPQFSTNISDAMEALNFYVKHNPTMLSYNLGEQLEKGPYSCTAELRFPSSLSGIQYVRCWASTVSLAIARVLAKAPKK
jgi:hypothetical protein